MLILQTICSFLQCRSSALKKGKVVLEISLLVIKTNSYVYYLKNSRSMFSFIYQIYIQNLHIIYILIAYVYSVHFLSCGPASM